MKFEPARPDSQTLHMEREYDCSIEEMWDAWTRPELLAQWISPFPGIDADVHTLEARQGGRISFTMIDDKGNKFPTEHGVYEVFEKPHRIVQYSSNADRNDIFKGYPQRLVAKFEALGPNRTKLVFETTGLPPNFPMDMARGGFGSCLQKLDDVVTGKANA